MSDDSLAELDIEVVSITCDQDGNITFDASGLSLERALFLLRSTEFMMMTDFWYGEDSGDEDDES